MGTGAATELLLDHVQDAIIVLDASLKLRYANRAARGSLPALDGSDADGDAEGFDAIAFVHPDDLDATMVALAPVLTGPDAAAMLRLRIAATEGWRPVEAYAVNHLDTPGVEGIVVCFRNLSHEIELTQALQLQSELRAQLVERERLLEHLLVIQTTIASRAPLTMVLQTIVEATSELTDAEVVMFHCIDPADGARLVMAASTGLDADEVVRFAAVRRDPVRDDDARRDDWRAGSEKGSFLERTPMTVAVPVRSGGELTGRLFVGRSSRPFEQGTDELLQLLADHAGRAVHDAEYEATLRHAFTDALTGLPNRRLLLDRLAQSIDRTARRGRGVAVLFIDLDGFKAINDGRGHQVGDRILCEVATRIAASIRGGDTAARWGGDEFVVVLEGADEFEAADIANRIVSAITVPIDEGGVAIYVSASVGVMSVSAGDVAGRRIGTKPPLDPEMLVRRADIAMYRGKKLGRSQVVFFESPMELAVIERTELEAEMREAVRRREIQVALQPIVDLRTGEMVGVEALARWSSPTRGPVPAQQFVELAETVGMVVELDRLVLLTACEEAGRVFAETGRQDLHLAVNMSARHFDHVAVVPDLLHVIDTAGFPPNRLLIEVTETAAMRDPMSTAIALGKLRDHGVRIAIDDFGTGYSSLTYLQQFPADQLKIDRSFVCNVGSARERELAAAMISLAHALGLTVTAEGIETAEQADVLTELGADFGQGFHFARPMSSTDLAVQLSLPRVELIAPPLRQALADAGLGAAPVRHIDLTSG